MKVEKAKKQKITVTDENGVEKVITKGMTISFDGDNMTSEMVDMTPIDIVRAAVGLLETIELLGLSDLLGAFLRSSGNEDE